MFTFGSTDQDRHNYLRKRVRDALIASLKKRWHQDEDEESFGVANSGIPGADIVAGLGLIASAAVVTGKYMSFETPTRRPTAVATQTPLTEPPEKRLRGSQEEGTEYETEAETLAAVGSGVRASVANLLTHNSPCIRIVPKYRKFRRGRRNRNFSYGTHC